jgi:peptidoglycan/xylan/chitin deacetylase (PgdA/CDA1 family)
MVEQMQVTIAEITGSPFTTSQLSTAHLERWIRAGNSIGNHTWDHPMLDRCTPLEQHRQVALAHGWINERLAPDQLLFAYPNGNWSRDAEAVLREFGYHAATLFNHRLSDLVDPFKLSRLRTNADGDLSRFRATVSGTHPFLSRLLRRT